MAVLVRDRVLVGCVGCAGVRCVSVGVVKQLLALCAQARGVRPCPSPTGMPRARARARAACLHMAARACVCRPRVITRGVGAPRRSDLLMHRGCGRDRRGFNLCCIVYALCTRSTHVRHQPARGPEVSSPVRTWRSRARCWYPRLPARVFVVPVGVCKRAHRPRVGVGTALVRVCCVRVCLFL